MKQMINAVMSAIVGGAVGAGVVFFAGNTDNNAVDLENLEAANLKVASLTITDQAVLLNEEGHPVVILREGSILADNVILAKKFVGRQLQGHAIVANRLFTTPDDLIATPMDQWRFFAEIGSSPEVGGEIVIRSDKGFASVNRPTSHGALLRVGFDTEAKPQLLGINNLTRSVLPISNDLTETQRQMLLAAMGNPQGLPQPAPGGFNSNAAAPLGNYTPSNDTLPVATQHQDGNAIR